jgi:hypothetical protein
MTLPCLLPADIAYATALKFIETAPKLTYNLKILSEAVIQLLARTLANISLSPATYSAKLTCQVAITEYADDIESQDVVYLQRKPSILNKMNFGFTLNIENRDAVPTAYHCNSRQHSLDLGDHDEETVERVLRVTSHQDAMMECYYLDHCDNKVEITEVYEVDDINEMTPTSTIITEIHEVDMDPQHFPPIEHFPPIDIDAYNNVNELQSV